MNADTNRPKMSAPTPETDAAWHTLHTGNSQPSWWVVAEKMRDHCGKLERERDEARERCAKLRDIAERAVNLGLGSHSFSLSDTAIKIAAALKRWRKSK